MSGCDNFSPPGESASKGSALTVTRGICLALLHILRLICRRRRRNDGKIGSSTGNVRSDSQNVRRRREMTWWSRLWNRRKMEDQLEEELRFHLDQHTAD